MNVVARVRLERVAGRRLFFEVQVDDEVETIGRGHHERYVIDRKRFDARTIGKFEHSVRR
ncbi:thioesterase family protein [Nocardia jiangxiensis]